MASRVFRKAAIDRLSSLEQLDQLVRVTPPQGWIALGLLSSVLAAAALWGWFGSIPVEIGGEGILQSAPASASQGQELEAVLFLPFQQGKKISAGMEAHIFVGHPANGGPEFIFGEVRRVDFLSRGGDPWTKVEITLKAAPDASVGGSSLPRAAWDQSNPEPITGKIIIQRIRPFDVLISDLRRRGNT